METSKGARVTNYTVISPIIKLKNFKQILGQLNPSGLVYAIEFADKH